ncbi:MAG TPA: OmpA family protein [Parafilimonas sp.]|nr:OmpA family protein [Parafilimonas sp.]
MLGGDKTPFIITIILAVLSWSVNRSIDRVLQKPLLVYDITQKNNFYSITFENLTTDKILDSISVYIILLKNGNSDLKQNDTIINCDLYSVFGILGPDECINNRSNFSFIINNFQPGFKLQAVCLINGNCNISPRIKSKNPVYLKEKGIETFLVQNELAIYLVLTLICIISIVLYFVLVTLKKPKIKYYYVVFLLLNISSLNSYSQNIKTIKVIDKETSKIVQCKAFLTDYEGKILYQRRTNSEGLIFLPVCGDTVDLRLEPLDEGSYSKYIKSCSQFQTVFKISKKRYIDKLVKYSNYYSSIDSFAIAALICKDIAYLQSYINVDSSQLYERSATLYTAKAMGYFSIPYVEKGNTSFELTNEFKDFLLAYQQQNGLLKINGYVTYETIQSLTTKTIGTIQPTIKELELNPLMNDRGSYATASCAISNLPRISFTGGSTYLSSAATSLLNSVAQQLMANPNCKVKLVGYGASDKRAQQLSWDHVRAIKTYLTERQGISESRIIFTYGIEGDVNTVDLIPTGEEGPNTVPAPHPNLRKG